MLVKCYNVQRVIVPKLSLPSMVCCGKRLFYVYTWCLCCWLQLCLARSNLTRCFRCPRRGLRDWLRSSVELCCSRQITNAWAESIRKDSESTRPTMTRLRCGTVVASSLLWIIRHQASSCMLQIQSCVEHCWTFTVVTGKISLRFWSLQVMF